MGVKGVSSEHGSEVLETIARNDIARLKSILDKKLKRKDEIRRFCESEVHHKPTKTIACPLMLACRLQDPRILRSVAFFPFHMWLVGG